MKWYGKCMYASIRLTLMTILSFPQDFISGTGVPLTRTQIPYVTISTIGHSILHLAGNVQRIFGSLFCVYFYAYPVIQRCYPFLKYNVDFRLSCLLFDSS